MGAFINLVGRKYGKLKVVSKNANKHGYWDCVCDCGNTKVAKGAYLRHDEVKSCGCLITEVLLDRNTVHGLRYHSSYGSWKTMKDRCYNKNNSRFNRYGARGIKVCDRWLGEDGAKNFIEDMGERPEGLTLDRIDNDGNYEPSNCKWSTQKEQANNRGNNRTIIYKGDSLTVAQWSRKLGISEGSIHYRLKQGCSISDCLSKNSRTKKKVVGINMRTKEVVEYNTLREAGDELGIFPQNISACCRGVGVSAGGYTWRYNNV